MNRPWLHSVTPVAPPRAANPSWRTLLYAAVVTGGWAGLLCWAVYGIARLAGVPFQLVLRQGEAPQALAWFMPLLLPLVAALAGAIATGAVLGRRHARAIVLWAGLLIALGSMALPLMQPSSVDWSTKILLALMHVMAFLVIVPQLARIAGDSEPNASEVRELQLESR